MDIFPYEVLTTSKSNSSLSNKNNKPMNTLVVYNYHLLNTQNRFFVFTQGFSNINTNSLLAKNNSLSSIVELFSAANWLERECGELHGLFFSGKKDLRNLMLQYGDSSCPFQKSFPSIGLKEMYYNPIKDTLIQNPVSIQI